ncbi:GerAB/ArcD/ProY family transporter [Falsibacillus albus]|uniref:GerAB/ArcD/ProY family transporter n=1 Tax=Falsibacillus albus TaxID=2478915 RepID=UPI00131408AE|nr:GerAB/ArcD/ProY family transporter [Falsibacillus albus]
MNNATRKVGTREFVALILLSLGIKFTDTTPTILFKETANAAWMVPFISGLVMIVPFIFLLKILKTYENLDLIAIIHDLFGKYVGWFIGMTLFFISFSSSISNTRSYVDIINTMFFPETSKVLIYLVFVGLAYFVANRGLQSITNTVWISLPYIKVSLIFIILLIWKNIHVGYLFPIAGYGWTNVMKQGVSYSSITSDLLFFSMLFPFFKDYKTFKTASFIGYGIVLVEIAIFWGMYIMLFDYPGIEIISYPFQEITRMLKLGRYVSNIEALFLGFWTVASIVRFAIYIYVSTATFAYTFKLKEFEPLLLPFSFLIILLGVLPENNVINAYIFRGEFILQGSWIFLFLLPPILWSVMKWKKAGAAK